MIPYGSFAQISASIRKNSELFLDIFEKTTIVLLFTYFAARLIATYIENGKAILLVFIFSEGLIVFFTLIRRPAKIVTTRWSDWMLGFVGTICPLLLRPTENDPLIAPTICGIMILLGVTLQIAAKLSLRRNIGIVAANRGVSTGGPYRLLRHPLYAAYALVGIGFVLLNPTFWNVSVLLIGSAVQVARIIVEERLLMNDASYRTFAEKVRYRVIPLIF